MAVQAAGGQAILAFAVALALGVGIGVVGFALGRILSPTRELPKKRKRYECANPPVGRARGMFWMQYYPYLILFLTVEPAMVYSFFVCLTAASAPVRAAGVFAGIFALLLPPLVYGLRLAGRIELWSAD